ncbi:MAG TPA: thioesterase domain-containing protein [Streptosporangiaceae bacterium]|jgi:thioesterase domain-containing protein|nr:thioesterase domain-containing protein [Streptosporangiaceae bacterium]
MSHSKLETMSQARRALYAKLQANRAKAQAGADHEPVPLRSGDGPARLVLLHPSGGALFCYTPLVRALRPDVDVIGFPADPADADLGLRTRLEVVAGRTLAALARITDPGGCVFSGWSHGGALAFEIARQHEAATGDHPSVVLLDAAYYGDRDADDESTVRSHFVYDFARLAGRDHAEVRAAVEAADPAVTSVRGLLEAAHVDPALTDAELAERYDTFRSCALGLLSYRPEATFAGAVVLCVAEQADAIDALWRRVATGPYRCVRLPGDHYTLFTPPVLPMLVGAIQDAADELAAVSAKKSGGDR